MILQALFKRYENLAKEDKLPLRGWSNEKVSFGIRLNEDGEIVQVVDLRQEVVKGKKKVKEPKSIKVPERIKRTSSVLPQVLCDNACYLLGIDNEGNHEKTIKKFESAREKHLELLKKCDSKVAVSIKKFFNIWNPDNAEIYEVLRRDLDEIKGNNNLIFMFDDMLATEDEDIKNAWQNSLNDSQKDYDIEKQQCLITGSVENIARIHPSVKGVLGAQTSGANIVAFNKGNGAFESYGKQDAQGLNAPISEYAAFAYTTALNALLADKNHVKHFGDTSIVYWAEKSIEEYQNAFDFFTFGDEANEMNNQTLNNAIEAIKNGKPIDFNDKELDAKTPFYILGLSPNAARISVRFFLESTFGDVLKNVITHHKNMDIVSTQNNSFVPMWKLEKSLISSKAKNADLSPVLAGSVFKSVLSGSFYPASLFANAMMRTKSEQDSKDDKGKSYYKITQERCAIIKAYLIKNKGREITVALNENETDTAYILGRIFSVLEKIQEKSAKGDINATIKDKYFNSFCATPKKIFPVLNKLSQHHLKKLEGGQKIYYEKMLTELMTRINPGSIPKLLPLEEQGMFVLGYYHQRQKLFTKKEDNKDE